MESILAGMKRIKREDECCCCFNNEDLFSMFDPHVFGEKIEIYSTMIAECFQIEFKVSEECNKNMYLICKNCVFRLRDAMTFRSQVQIAYVRLKAEGFKKDDQYNILNDYTEIEDTKENILKCEIVEYDNAEIPGASLSSKVVYKKNDNKKIVSTRKHLKKVKTENGGYDSKSQLSNRFTCDICNKSYKNLRTKQQHMIIHQNKCFGCDHCGKSFKRRDHLIIHVKTHTNNEIFVCNYCGKSCKTMSRLINHSKTHVDKFLCDICNRVFRRKQNLRDHIMAHMGMFDVKCDICKNDFVSKVALRKHVQMHRFQSETCRYCNKSFGNKKNLKQHMSIHLGRQTFDCKICGKTLCSKRSFNDHLLIHSGVKSQKCESCEEAFVTRYMLLKHMKIHLNPK